MKYLLILFNHIRKFHFNENKTHPLMTDVSVSFHEIMHDYISIVAI